MDATLPGNNTFGEMAQQRRSAVRVVRVQPAPTGWAVYVDGSEEAQTFAMKGLALIYARRLAQAH
jgi:hypothetical protein